MRLLHVIATGDRRGAEVFASDLVSALVEDGVDEQVAILKSEEDPDVRFDVPATVMEGHGPSLPGIQMNVGRIRGLRRLEREFRPDVVQAHGGESLKYAMAADLGKGSRIVYRRIGDSSQFGGSKLRERAYATLMRRTARVVAVADVLNAELVGRFGLAPSLVVTIPNGVDQRKLVPSRPRAQIRESLGVRDDAPVVLSVGALTWEKDPLAHIHVVAGAAARHTDLVHLLAGDGPLRSQVTEGVRRLGAEERTLLLGSRGDIADLLAAADVLLLASRTEGMPACVIEAGMAGLPVVGYSLSGVPEVVVDGETGVLVPPGDLKALSRALSGLLGDDERRRRMGSAALERCRTRFDIGLVAPMYLRVYEAVARAA